MAQIAQITIPNYITKIQLSKARRAKFYKKGDKIPKKYLTTNHRFDDLGYLCDEKGDKVVKNPRTAGTPKYEALSGNKLTSGYATPHIRNKISTALKDFYAPHVRKMKPIAEYPLIITWEFWTTVQPANFDMSNFWFYYKYFEDTLVSEGIIPDDNIKYITGPAAPILVPVDSVDKHKFVFTFYKDERSVITNHDIWKMA